MGFLRESSDPIFVRSSSIVLLQERFRQLQRVKEMRQERELLRKLSHVPTPAYDLCPNTTKVATEEYDHEPISSGALFFHFLPIKATTTTATTTISNLVSDSAQRNFELETTPILIKSLLDADRHQFCGHKRNVVPAACKFGASGSDDVDTSLHL